MSILARCQKLRAADELILILVEMRKSTVISTKFADHWRTPDIGIGIGIDEILKLHLAELAITILVGSGSV